MSTEEVPESSMLGALIRRRRWRRGFRLPPGNLFLAKELRKVGSLKPQRFGRPGLVPVVFFQRVFEHPTTVGLHHRVITGCVAWPVLNPLLPDQELCHRYQTQDRRRLHPRDINAQVRSFSPGSGCRRASAHSPVREYYRAIGTAKACAAAASLRVHCLLRPNFPARPRTYSARAGISSMRSRSGGRVTVMTARR